MLAAQGAGMIIDYMGRENQIELGRQGEAMQQQNISEQIQTSRLQTEDASLQAMKQLRMNLGTQAATLAARGIRSGAGTAALFGNESVGNFNADERIRKVNQRGNEAALKAGGMIASLHQQTAEANTWNEFRTNAINKIPTTPEAWDQISKGFSAESGYGFGLSKVGG